MLSFYFRKSEEASDNTNEHARAGHGGPPTMPMELENRIKPGKESPVKAHFAVVVVSAALLSVGCANKKAASSNALDISDPITPVYTAPQPVAVQPVAQPVVYDTQPAAPQASTYASAQPSMPAAGSGSYTVKRGDTLFSIAKSRYGNGNQWQRIAQANPGLSPQTLKAGQTISVP